MSGVIACALALPEKKTFSNNGSLYVGYNEDKTYFCIKKLRA